jgi:WD40 repeat protein
MPLAEHPSPADLRAFALGTLSDEAHSSVESHLADCPDCQQAAATTPDDTLVTLLRSAETSQAGPVTPGTGFAETVALSPAGIGGEGEHRPPELANHPRYRLIRPLGRGGMGHVWLAEHTVMGRPVALKLVRPEFLDRPEAVERFRREVRAAARLNHPHIVAAHDAEQAGGTHFLVMEYIDGETLAERIDAGTVSVEDACRWAIDAARGLEHARSQGLIHRDVKPHNLIRERATGRVKVLDFGLAGVSAGETSGLTGGNVVIGTPDYIAPEQAMDARKADTRSDVYSLGCTLYHLLAGRPPFAGETVLQKIDAHRTDEPTPLTAIRQDMTPALAELVARMLAKDSKDRPQTPGEVAVALEDLLAGRGGEPPVPARGRRGWGGRWRRRWGRVAVGALVLLGALGAVVYKLTDVADVSVSNEAPDQVKWVIKKDGYVVSKPSSALSTSLILPAGGEYTVELDGPDEFVARPKSFAVRRGEQLTVRIVPVVPKPQPAAVDPAAPAPVRLVGGPKAPWVDLLPFLDPTRDAEHGELRPATGGPGLVVKDTGGFARVAVPVRPNGDYEIKARVARVGGNDSFNLMLPLPVTGGRTQVGVFVDGFPDRGGATGLEWKGGPGMPMTKTLGRRLETGKVYDVLARVTTAGGRVTIRVEADGTSLFEWTGPVNTPQSGINFFTNDRRQVGFGACAGAFRVERFEFRPLSGSAEWVGPSPAPDKPGPVRRFGRYKGAVVRLALSPDGSHVFASDDGMTKWEVGGAARTPVWAADGSAQAIPTLSGDGKVFVAWGQDGQAHVLDPATGKQLRTFPLPAGAVLAAALNKDGTRAFVSQHGEEKGPRPAIRAWDVTAGKPLYAFDGHTDDTYGLALSPDGTRVATASYDKSIRVWDAGTGEQDFTFFGYDAQASSVAWSADGKYLVTGDGDNAVRVWSVDEGRCVSLLTGHTEWVTDVAFTPDGTRVVSVSGYKGKGDGIRVWDWRAGVELHHFADVRGPIGAVKVSPDGRDAITGEHGGDIRVWRLPPPPSPPPADAVGPGRRFGRFLGGVEAVALSADGKYVYSQDVGVVKWDLAGERMLWSHGWPNDSVTHIAADPDGRHVLVAFADGPVRVLDAADGKTVGTYAGHKERVVQLAVSPDGKRAVSSSGNKDQGPVRSIRVWEIDTLKDICELKGHREDTWGLAFSPTGDRVATASDDGTVRVWDATTGADLAVLTGTKGMATTVAWSPDGKQVAAGGQDLTVRVWDVATKAVVHTLEGHNVWVSHVAFTPDGTRLVSVGAHWEQGTGDGVRVWDAKTGERLYDGVAGNPAVGLAVDRDGRYAVTGGMDGAIRVWRLPPAPKR